MKKRYIKIPKNFSKNFKAKPIKLPTIKCSCGEEVLDTPFHRLQADLEIEQAMVDEHKKLIKR